MDYLTELKNDDAAGKSSLAAPEITPGFADYVQALRAACARAIQALEANGAPNCEAAKECRAALSKAR